MQRYGQASKMYMRIIPSLSKSDLFEICTKVKQRNTNKAVGFLCHPIWHSSQAGGVGACEMITGFDWGTILIHEGFNLSWLSQNYKFMPLMEECILKGGYVYHYKDDIFFSCIISIFDMHSSQKNCSKNPEYYFYIVKDIPNSMFYLLLQNKYQECDGGMG